MTPKGSNPASFWHERGIMLAYRHEQTTIEAAKEAVDRGHAASASAWVNEPLRLKLGQERRMAALAAFVAAYEREHGEITPEEMQMAVRRAGQRALVVRGPRSVKETQSPSRSRSK